MALSNVTEEITEEELVIKTIQYNETVSDKISFKEYFENIYQIEGSEAVVKGFLNRYIRGSEMAGVYVESIEDDYSNIIDLVNVGYEYQELFPHKGATEEVYQITGIFRRDYKTLLLEVKDIKLSKRDPSGVVTKERIIELKENTTKTITRARYAALHTYILSLFGRETICEDGTKLNNCSKVKPYFCSYSGLIKKANLCGCSLGERLYKGECIKEVKCKDGTLEPECSGNKPKQCVDGELVDNSNLCGCPEDHRKIENECIEIKRCLDGTEYGDCSGDRPYFCSGGKLIKDSQMCGCEMGYRPWKGDCIDSNKADTLDAFEYINEIRREYGRSELQWDDNLYELAIFRSKDMYDRKYFDHVTPDGKCVKDFKFEYGLGDYTIAENAGAVIYGYDDDGKVNYASYASPRGQVDNWMNSRGHRYNLLYADHILGVAACYKGACVFLGANEDPYGLGAGPCTTGKEGMAFWSNLEKQPDEI